jgi:hypothetical protein
MKQFVEEIFISLPPPIVYIDKNSSGLSVIFKQDRWKINRPATRRQAPMLAGLPLEETYPQKNACKKELAE